MLISKETIELVNSNDDVTGYEKWFSSGGKL